MGVRGALHFFERKQVTDRYTEAGDTYAAARRSRRQRCSRRVRRWRRWRRSTRWSCGRSWRCSAQTTRGRSWSRVHRVVHHTVLYSRGPCAPYRALQQGPYTPCCATVCDMHRCRCFTCDVHGCNVHRCRRDGVRRKGASMQVLLWVLPRGPAAQGTHRRVRRRVLSYLVWYLCLGFRVRVVSYLAC